MATEVVKVYCVDIDSKKIDQDYGVQGITIITSGEELYPSYDIDFSNMRIFVDKIGYGVIAVNNGTVYPLYEMEEEGYTYSYYIKENIYFGDDVMDSWIIYYSSEPVIYSNEEIWREALMTEDNIEARIKFGDNPYTTSAIVEENDDIQFTNITVSSGMISGSYLSYGDIFSPTCTVEMTECIYAIPNVWFRIEFKIDGVWQCFGVFLINTPPEKTSEYISFSGTGILESVLGKKGMNLSATLSIKDIIYNISAAGNVPVIIDFLDQIKKQYFTSDKNAYETISLPGRTTAEEDSDGNITYTNENNPYGENYRDALSYIATAFHSNVIERNGAIHITHLKDVQYESRGGKDFLFDASQYMEEPPDLGYYYYAYPIKVSCQQSKPDPRNKDTSFNFIYMDNANREITIMDQKVTTDDFTLVAYPITINADPLWTLVTKVDPNIWNTELQYCAFRYMVENCGFNKDFIAYKPLSVEFNGYHPCIYPGNKIAIKNGNSIDYRALVGNVTITYDGGISVAIDTPCNVDFSENKSTSGGTGVSSTSGIASFTSFVMSVQDASVINDGVITGSKIADSTITGSNIASSTITNSLIADSTLTGVKIKDAEIGFEKVDSSFINNLTAADAYLLRLKSSVADIDSLTADDAIIKNIQSVAISAEYIRSATADIGYLIADEANLIYADINLANIDVANIDRANIGLLLAEIGLLDRATIVEGHVTGFLDSVEVNASSITAGTLVADRILLRGSEEGLLFALNNMGELVSENIDSIDGYVLAERTVNADKLVAHSITANEIDVENLFAQDILATGTITGATLKGTYAEIEDGKVGAFSILTDQLTAGISSGVYHYTTSFNAGNTGDPGGTGITVFSYNEELNEMLTYGYLNCNKMQWADNANAVSFTVNKEGVVTEGKTKLAANKTQGGSLSDYSVQIGSTSSNHLNMGARTIQASTSTNAAASLFLNSYGGDVNVGKSGSNVYIAGNNVSMTILFSDNTALSTSGTASVQSGSLTDDISNYKRVKIFAKNNNGYIFSKELYSDGSSIITTFNIANLGWLQATVVSISGDLLTVNLTVQRNITSSVSNYSNSTRYLQIYRIEGYKS